MRQIRKAVLEAMAEAGGKGSVTVTVHVPDGERIALHTMNLRLGIVGGISILGTRGTVIPFSNEAYESTITMGMDVAVSAKIDTIALSTGGKSEKFLKNYEPLPEQAFIQIADFFAFSLKEAMCRAFARIVIACFFGKLVKMAQGFEYTHARESRISFDTLADWCLEFGMKDVNRIRNANTAREVFDMIIGSVNPGPVFAGITSKALDVACRFAGKDQSVSFYLFDMSGKPVCRMDRAPSVISR
jgi:cobalt-precorrin-5B (C1)-methyltransferase